MATTGHSFVSLGASLRNNALFRLIAMSAGLMVWLIGFRALAIPAFRQLGEAGTLVGDVARLAGALIYIAGALVLYSTLVRVIERRDAGELARQSGAPLALLGFLIGLVLSFAVIGTLWLAGAAMLAGFGDSSRLIAQFSAAAMASVAEELLFRGILFRILEQAVGTLRALLASALFFGLAHIVNPDATLATALIIAIESGVMLGLAFVAARNLWLPIGIHLAWNFAQGGLFGSVGDASSKPSLFRFSYTGPEWITGGSAGTENSIVTVTLCVILAAIFAIVASRRGKWKSAQWNWRLD